MNTTISAQKTLIIQLQKMIEATEIREKEHTKREKNLTEQIEYLTKKLFCSSSEHRNGDLKWQLNLFDESETARDESAAEPDLEAVIKEHTRKTKTKLAEKMAGIPVEEVPVDIPEEEKVCPPYGTALALIGKEVVRREIEYIPAKVTVKEYVSYHYGCPECKNTDESYIIKTTTEKKPLMKHSLASPSSVAWTIYQKYANAMPLYRQEKDWKQYGIELSRLHEPVKVFL